MAKKPSSAKGAIYTYCDAKAVKDMINAFLNEMEVALMLDVKEFYEKNLISNSVYEAFLNRDMAELDRLFKEDLESTRITQMREQASIKGASSSGLKKLTKWDGEHFKALLPNSLFKHSQAVSKNTPPILLLGSPGIGKSDIIRSIAMDRKFGKEGILDIRLSQKEAVDMRGFPVPNDVTRTVDWFISSEWPRNPLSRGILFFDELTSATKAVQVGAYEIILDRKLGDIHSGGYELPPGWFICAAGNLADDDAAVEDVSSALANRMMHLVIEVDVDSWLIWAEKNGVHPAVISYITTPSVYNGLESRYKLHCMNTDANGRSPSGKLLPVVDRQKGWPSPRSWTRLSSAIQTYETAKSFTLPEMRERYKNILSDQQIVMMSISEAQYLSSDTLEDMIIGLIGLNLGQDFIAFYTSFKIAVDSAINLALLGVNQSSIAQIDDHSTYPLITKDNINNIQSFGRIQATNLSINNDIKPVSEYEGILNKLFDPHGKISEQDQQEYRRQFGSEPLAFLTAIGVLLASPQYIRQLEKAAGLQKPIASDTLAAAYKLSIRNVVEFMSTLRGSAAFAKSFFATSVSGLPKSTSMSSNRILSDALNKALKERSLGELKALMAQAGSEAADGSNQQASSFIIKASSNLVSNSSGAFPANMKGNNRTGSSQSQQSNTNNGFNLSNLSINTSTNYNRRSNSTAKQSNSNSNGLARSTNRNKAATNIVSVRANDLPEDIDE